MNDSIEKNPLEGFALAVAAREEVCARISESAVLDRRFIFMNSLAAIVAAYGLVSDSTATVIGAMVIATLLGSIFGVALALVRHDLDLLRSSLSATVAGIAIVLSLSMLIGWFHRWLPLSAEILSRTHPNLIDLAIALAGGAAGAYAVVSPRINAGLVGVAIATALVPPLSACGICIARGEWWLALGAFELFLTNFVAIQFTTSVMIWLFGFRHTESLSWFQLLRRNRVSLLLLLGMSIVLAINLVRTVQKHQLQSLIRDRIVGSMESVEQAELLSLKFAYDYSRNVSVTAMVLTPAPFPSDVVAKIKSELPRPVSQEIDIKMLYILSAQITQAKAETFESQPADSSENGDSTGEGKTATPINELPAVIE